MRIVRRLRERSDLSLSRVDTMDTHNATYSHRLNNTNSPCYVHQQIIIVGFKFKGERSLAEL